MSPPQAEQPPRKKLPRVFIGMVEIAGFYDQLIQGLRALGCEADLYLLEKNRFGYGRFQKENLLTRLCRAFYDRKAKSKLRIVSLFWLLLQDLLKLILLIRVLPRYDVFIYSYRSSFFHYLELPVLKALNKRIIYVFHGSDSRPPYMDGFTTFPNPAALKLSTDKIKRFVTRVEKYADVVIVNPASAQFLSRPFINSMMIGVPFSMPYAQTKAEKHSGLRIVHSPSNRRFKGTDTILKAIKEQQTKYTEIELVEVRQRPHHEVLEILQNCDIVIDQLYSDTPMAGLAAEAAYFAKPCIVGSYCHSLFSDYIPVDKMPPSFVCAPDALSLTLEHVLQDKEKRMQMGHDAQAFLQTHWTPEAVALAYLKVICNEIPEDWWLEPESIVYPYGAGISARDLKYNLQRLLNNFGLAALHLSHHPKLELALLELSTEDPSKE